MKISDGKEIPEGATQIHLYNSKDVLMPRGSMKKESLGEYISNRLDGVFEDWTNPSYGDNPPADLLLLQMKENLDSEVSAAWKSFTTKLRKGSNDHIDGMILHLSIMAADKPKPSLASPEVKYFLDVMNEDDELMIESICFIDRYDRTSKEFKYFTQVHILFIHTSEKYVNRMEEVSNPKTKLGKLMYERV